MRNCVRAVAVLCFFIPATLIAQSSDEFSVIMLPDTQHYSRNYPEIFTSQTRWIADNRSRLNIKFVVGVGDIVNDGESDTQYQNADAAIDILDRAAIPYVLPLGNHDYMYSSPSGRNSSKFNQYFGPSRYSKYSWYRGGYPANTNDNFYALFDVNGKKYVVLALEFYPRKAALAWADTVVTTHRDKEVIVLTHSYINTDNSRVGRCDYANAEGMGVGKDNDGDELWANFIRRHANITLVLSGHIHGVGRRADAGVNGNLVNQILADYQGEHRGGNGYLRILKFKPAQNKIEVSTYSPYAGAYRTDSANQFSVPMYRTATTGTGTLDGTVRSYDCQELPSATVSYGDKTASTNAAGRFALSASAPSSGSATSKKSGWEPLSFTSTLTAGTAELKDFYLRPALPCPLNTVSLTVTICTPRDGGSVASPVRIAAGGRSSSTITKLVVYVDGSRLYETTGDRVDTYLAMRAGTRSVTVRAYDSAGHIFSDNISVNVTSSSSYCSLGSSKSVTICTPSTGTTNNSPVRIKAGAVSSRSIKYMSIYLDGVKVYQVFSDRIDTWLRMGAREHRLTVRATDSGGSTFSKTVKFTTELPSSSGSSTNTASCYSPSGITICTPATNASVPTSFTVTAASAVPLNFMQVYLDGVKTYEVRASELSWTATVTPGTHRLAVQGKDAAGTYYKDVAYVTAQ